MLLSPVVRRLVNEHGLDPAQITGTGPGGRITRDDVLDHIDQQGAKPPRRGAPGAGPEGAPAPARPLQLPSRCASRGRAGAAPAPTVASGERDSAVTLSRRSAS